MKARVYRSTGSWYTLKDTEGNWVLARLAGKYRTENLKNTNPIAVGDWVDITLENTETDTPQAIINDVIDRDNYIVRRSPKRMFFKQVIAANIDQALLFITFRNPRTSLGFVDRFLLTAEMYHIKTILVFNKLDLYNSKDVAKFADAKAIYENLGYTCLAISAKTGEGMDIFKDSIVGKTNLIAGHSGAGKSTTMNYIDPELELETRYVSKHTGKGQHTTTFATMYDMQILDSKSPINDTETRLIDTPGIKELSIIYLPPDEVAHYFVEMKDLLGNCKFGDCTHRNEPGCAIKSAVAADKIAESRYKSYLQIRNEIEDINYWEREV